MKFPTIIWLITLIVCIVTLIKGNNIGNFRFYWVTGATTIYSLIGLMENYKCWPFK